MRPRSTGLDPREPMWMRGNDVPPQTTAVPFRNRSRSPWGRDRGIRLFGGKHRGSSGRVSATAIDVLQCLEPPIAIPFPPVHNRFPMACLTIPKRPIDDYKVRIGSRGGEREEASANS
eukprot:scaffold1313_cov349-Pavlova_lutheri.AAC.6